MVDTRFATYLTNTASPEIGLSLTGGFTFKTFGTSGKNAAVMNVNVWLLNMKKPFQA